jgi:glycosyltransferase involved in cell wall biosynthesis
VKILVGSPAYLPLVGGLEINTAGLAESMQRAGHEVVVLTHTPADAGQGGAAEGSALRVVRRPSPWERLRWTRWCDVFYQANVALHDLWPIFLVPRPWVVSHHSWYTRSDGRVAWQDRLKRYLLRFAAGSIAVSEAIAADLDTPATVIPNAYRSDLFRRLAGVPRDRDLAFLGRLVSDKGVDLLLDALALLAAEAVRPGLSVIGSGPEREALEAQAARLGLSEQVEFLGTRQGEELVELLNRHRVLVVPSRYEEPFGLVALEGIACGCFVVGSAGGGLRQAIGPCGRTFPNGDTAALARQLKEVLPLVEDYAPFLERAATHLATHTYDYVAYSYLRVIENAVHSRRPRHRRRPGRAA